MDGHLPTGNGCEVLAVANKSRQSRRGLDEYHPHQHRHTLAVELLQAGTTIQNVSLLLWHSSVTVAEEQRSAWERSRRNLLAGGVLRANCLDPVVAELDPIHESQNPTGIDSTGPHAKSQWAT